MEHKEFKRIVCGSTTAILFIHGIVGTPNHFNELVSLVPESLSVYNMLLEGHGKEVKDFSKASMEKWEAQVTAAVEELSSTHNEIYIVAHSMGALLAIEQAVKCEKVAKLFILAMPMKLSLKPRMITNSLKVYFNRIRPDDREAIAAKECYGINGCKNPFQYLGWIPRFLELFLKIRYTRKNISALNTPCFAYQSGKDEMVSSRSFEYLKQNPRVSVGVLENSGHYYYDEKDWSFLLGKFESILI